MDRTLCSALLAAFLLAAPGAADAGCDDLGGEAVQGGLLWGRVPPGSRVTLDGDALPVLPDGWFLAGFGRDAAATASLVVSGPAPCERMLSVSTRDYRIQRVEGVPQRTVTPPPGQLERIRRERELVVAAKARRLEEPEWLKQVVGAFRWPATGPISGVYGSQRVYNGTPGNPHYGVDVAAPTGTPVHAPADGLVTLAEPDLFYSGGTIILDHGYGLSSSFLHLSEVGVAVGDRIPQGGVIGAVGASGRATGPHLDWRMSFLGRRVDPQRLVPPMPKP
ncbi:M23 family metallopeptidase [Pseudohaliea rubra]|uniref:Peptidase, M23/M37 family n=1 Tax=Pseudohaliea rubra DSM 19751 TaxID=1265313 RepID=A0A095VSV9_9GAMM|nr:M23 family metallopeptidase [Pseudohaliea rubra]KGE04537.1 Peptidase, M23/M37 family [Pseudohaliea rubra DSM 19751]